MSSTSRSDGSSRSIQPGRRLIVTDYRRGLLSIDPGSGVIEIILGAVDSEGLRG